MKQFLVFLICLLFLPLAGQDAEARRILDRLNDRYVAYSTLEINFKLEIDYPDRKVEHQQGSLIQDGKKYVFKTDAQEIYGDGKDVWIYFTERNEVQINNYEEDEDGLSIITPKDLFRQYKSGRFDYAITDSGKGRTYIEFKPVDDDTEYSKFRLEIVKDKVELKSVFALGLDGSKVLFTILSETSNKTYPDAVFTFNPENYPGVFIEDLRID